MVGARAGRRTRGGLVVALATVLLGLLVPVASAAGTSPADLPGPYTGITARAWGAVSPAPRQTTRAVDGRDGPVMVTGSRSDTWESWTVAFAPREGSPVALNVRGPRVGVGLTGMTASLRFGATFCAAATPGSDAPVVVTEYHLDPATDRPDVLSVDITGPCQVDHTSDRQQMDVHLRLGASTPYGGLDVPTDVVDLGSPVIGVAGAAVSVPVRYVGSGSVAVASPEVVDETGHHPSTSMFRYPLDTCSGRTLGDGDRCSTSVQMRPVGATIPLCSFVLHGSDGAVVARVPVTWDEAPARTDPVGSLVGVANRALDTRQQVGSTPPRQIPSGGVVSVPVGAFGGSPTPSLSGGLALLNLTAVAPSATGYLSVLPSATAPTTTSAVNFTAGRTTSNLVLAPIDAAGYAHVRNGSARPVDVVADLQGVTQPREGAPFASYGAITGRLHPVPPSRVLDTRTAVGGARPLPSGVTVLGLRLPTFTHPSTAVLATVTVVSPSGPGWVRLGGPDGTSSVTYAARETTSNTVLAWMGGSQFDQLTVTVLGSPVHVVVDVMAVVDDGYSPSGVVVAPLAGGPVRIADSRRDFGVATLPAGTARSLQVPASLRDQDTWGVMQNLVAIPSRPTSVTAYASGTTRPGTSSVLATTPGPRAATVLTGLSASGSQDLFATAGPTDVVSDVSARVQLFPSTAQLGGFDRIPESLAAIPPATRSR